MLRTGRLSPWLYVTPALVVLAFFLIYPSIHTIYLSFFGKRSIEFVGLENYIYAFTNDSMIVAFRNNALWVIFFTSVAVSMGLILAVLLDRVRYEPIAKSIVFLPMAVSMVGASVIWKFIYAYRPPIVSQVGLFNAIITFFGGQPLGWLIEKPWNNFFIMIVGVWIWTGFCMVVLSAAYKNIPKEIIEAARIDGASEWQVFWKVILPLMRPTLAMVGTTMVVFVLKIFDLVYVMTNGNYDTEVIANRMYKMFQYPDFGKASALAVILVLLIIPMMWLNISRVRRQREMR